MSTWKHTPMKEWYSKQMDFILAYLHAPAEVPLYLNFPKRYKFKEGITTKPMYSSSLRTYTGRSRWGGCGTNAHTISINCRLGTSPWAQPFADQIV